MSNKKTPCSRPGHRDYPIVNCITCMSAGYSCPKCKKKWRLCKCDTFRGSLKNFLTGKSKSIKLSPRNNNSKIRSSSKEKFQNITEIKLPKKSMSVRHLRTSSINPLSTIKSQHTGSSRTRVRTMSFQEL